MSDRDATGPASSPVGLRRGVSRLLSRAAADLRLPRLGDSVLDVFDLVTRRRDPLMPPRKLLRIWEASGFSEIGRTFCRHFVELGGLKPDDTVLEIGCGVGRMAIALTTHLSDRGRYEGLDVIEDGVRWCDRHITPRYPSFRFRVADVWNGTYNPKGRHNAAQYRFPYESEHFDFVFLTSVFTHMLPADVSNYVAEIARVLKPGGRCFCTFFLLRADAEAMMRAGKSHITFDLDHGSYRTVAGRIPESAVAHPEDLVFDEFRRRGLVIEAPVHYGSWCGRTEFRDYQDILITKKR